MRIFNIIQKYDSGKAENRWFGWRKTYLSPFNARVQTLLDYVKYFNPPYTVINSQSNTDYLSDVELIQSNLFLPCLIRRNANSQAEGDVVADYKDPDTDPDKKDLELAYSITNRVFSYVKIQDVTYGNPETIELSSKYFDAFDIYFPSYLDFRQGMDNRSNKTSYVFLGDLKDFIVHGGEIRKCYFYETTEAGTVIYDQAGKIYQIDSMGAYEVVLDTSGSKPTYVKLEGGQTYDLNNLSALKVKYLLLKERYISELQGTWKNNELKIKWYYNGKESSASLNTSSSQSVLDPRFRAKLFNFIDGQQNSSYVDWSLIRIKYFDTATGEEEYIYLDTKTRALLAVFPANMTIFQNRMATQDLDDPGTELRDDINNYMMVPKSTGAFYTFQLYNGSLIATYEPYAEDNHGLSVIFNWELFNQRYFLTNNRKTWDETDDISNTSVSLVSCNWTSSLATSPSDIYIANGLGTYWSGSSLIMHQLSYQEESTSFTEDVFFDGLASSTTYQTLANHSTAQYNLVLFVPPAKIGKNTIIDLF